LTRLAIQAAIKTILEGVTDIGNVYDSIRWVNDKERWDSAFLKDIDGQSEIRVWMLYRISGEEAYGASDNAAGTGLSIPIRTRLQRYNYQIEGMLSFTDDDTDVRFQALLDSVIDAFKNKQSLNDTAIFRGPINYTIDHQFFGEVLVHHVILNLYAVERDGITPT
jgi:hypothetical protein